MQRTLSKLGFCVVLTLIGTPSVFAVPAFTDFGFGPFVGGGTISAEETSVQHSSGFRLYADRRFGIGNGITVGPQLEAINGFFNTKTEFADNRAISNYDNRILALGARISSPVNIGTEMIPEVFASIVGGGGRSKLSVDQSTESSFASNLYSNISGRYTAAEIGVGLPVAPKFNIQLGLQRSMYIVDQSNVSGTQTLQGPLGLAPVDSQHTPGDGSVESRVVQKGLSGTFALAVTF